MARLEKELTQKGTQLTQQVMASSAQLCQARLAARRQLNGTTARGKAGLAKLETQLTQVTQQVPALPVLPEAQAKGTILRQETQLTHEENNPS